jgi:hypothetical protein
MNRPWHWLSASGALWFCGLAMPLDAQVSTSTGRVPGCAKEFCQEMILYATALDSLLTFTGCRSQPAVVLRTLHSAPYSRRDARSGRSLLEPQSPVLGRIDDGPDPFRQFGQRVRIVDLSEIHTERLARSACIFVFSPVTWLGESLARIIVLEVQPPGSVFYERYIYLRRENGSWTITLIEAGMVS